MAKQTAECCARYADTQRLGAGALVAKSDCKLVQSID